MKFLIRNVLCVLFAALFLVACTEKESEELNEAQTKLAKPLLGVVYDADYLRKLLVQKENESLENYTLGGFVFKNIVEKEFTLEAHYFSSAKADAFCSEPIANSNRHFVSISNNQENAVLTAGQQELIKKRSSVEFWDVLNKPENSHMKPFAFFSKSALELLLSGNVESVTFSGAQINYGGGLRDATTVAVDLESPTVYPTLKAESNLGNNNNNEYITNFVFGLPCPPQWSDGEGGN